MARKYYSDFEGYNTKMFRDTETNEIFIQQKIDKPPPEIPTPYTTDYFDIVVKPWMFEINNRITPYFFYRSSSELYEIRNNSELISDYYSFQFDIIGIKNYKFVIHGNNLLLQIDDVADKAQFEFYYSDIIKNV